jgi:hypothetical protein
VIEKLRAWGSCLGLVALLALMGLGGLIAYQIDRNQQPQRGAQKQDPVMMRLTGTTLQVFSDPGEGKDPTLVAEIAAELIEVSRDQTRTEISNITAIEIYREGQVYLTGSASRATYDEQLKELTVREGIKLAQVEQRIEMECEEIVYYTDTSLLVATRRVTAKMGDSVLKTPTARVNVATQTFSAPRKVAVTTGKGGSMYADSASGYLDGQKLSLIGNVLLSSTVGELRGLAEETGSDAAKPAGAIGANSSLRVRTGRADILLAEKKVAASDGISVVTEQGSVTAKAADISGERVQLTGGATITLAGKPPSGPVTVETATVEYRVKEDVAVCPSAVTARVREGEFRAGRAEARLMKGSWRLQGGVKGTLRPNVIRR